MRVSNCIGCTDFPCKDVLHDRYSVPQIEIDEDRVMIILISEAAPDNRFDYYYAPGSPSFQRSTVQAFQDAGADVNSVQDILDLGVYLTTAVKCGKTGYGIQAATIRQCSKILETEIALFRNVQAYLLMGDVAIRAINHIAKRSGEPRVIPPGSTYKIRSGEYYFRSILAFPSYLQAGPSYGIEKSKQRMIAEDIAAALAAIT
jgi:uracil-DNA glycosylase